MQIHELLQGSDAWDDYRLVNGGASEAGAMLGIPTAKMKRNELLHMKKTGTAKQFSDWVRTFILDPGHTTEASARPIIEARIGQPLYPVTGSIEGRISASCDGLTIDDRIAMEHKRWNKEYAELVRAGFVPDEHMPQCQQVLMVTGAEVLIFVVSDGTEENMEMVEVRPDPEWFDRLRAGWAQFWIDFDAYVPVEAAPKLQAATIQALPALIAHIKGEVTQTNLADYKVAADKFIDGIKTELETDQDFIDAAAIVNFCDAGEKQLALVKAQALSSTATISELFTTIDHITARLREKRLDLDKKVEAQKAARKIKIVNDGKTGWAEHIAKLETEIAPLKLVFPAGVAPDFAAAAKNKRTTESLQDSVDTALANGKIAADAFAAGVREKLAAYKESTKGTDETPNGYAFLFADLQGLIGKPVDDFRLAVKSRIDDHVAREAAAAAKRKEDDEKKAAAAAAAKPVEQPAPVAVQEVAAPAAAPSPAPAVFRMPVRAAANEPVNSKPTLSLGQIGTRLGFSLTAAFIGELGFAPAGRERAAVLYQESDFPLICAALVEHIQGVQTQRHAA